MTVTLYTRKPLSAYALSSEGVVSYLGLDVNVEAVSPTPNKQFEELFPASNRFTPSLYDSSNGLVINQAVAVNRYLVTLAKDDKGIEGSSAVDRAETLMWANFVDSEIYKKVKPVVDAMFVGNIMSREEVDSLLDSASKGFSFLEQRLAKSPYLLGDKLTLADIEAAGLLFVPLSFFVTEAWQKKYPAVVKWATTVLNGEVYKARLQGSFAVSATDSLDKFWPLKAAYEGKA